MIVMAGHDFSNKDFLHYPMDEKFLRKVDKIIQSNLDDEQFSVESLAEAMSMSRMHLYRKLQRLTGKNVSQYIREYRLRKAKDMLQNDVATVSEIAYMVGFGSPAYFNKCFHDLYGYPPGEIKRIKQQKNATNQDQKKIKEKIEGREIFLPRRRGMSRHQFFRYSLYVLAGVVIIIAVFSYLTKIYVEKEVPESVSDKTIAILPFRNDGPDSEHDYIFNVIQEEIINRLQIVRDIRVKPRQSVEQYRNTDKNIPTIGKELNVAYLLDPSGQFIGDTLRLWIKLIDSRTDEQVWVDLYDIPYKVNSILNMQSRVANKVVASLGAVIKPEEQFRMYYRKEPPIEAYDMFLRGRQEIFDFWNGDGVHHAERALQLYNKALKIDKEFAAAMVGKAEVYSWKDRNLDSVAFYCDKALTLEPEFWYAYFVKAFGYTLAGKSDEAIRYWEKFIELYPDFSPFPYTKLGELLFRSGDVIKGLTYLKRSLELDTAGQYNRLYSVSGCYFYIGDNERALQYAMKWYEASRNCWGIKHIPAIFLSLNRLDEAFDFLDSNCEKTDCKSECYSTYANLYLLSHDYHEAEKHFDLIYKTFGEFNWYDDYHLACLYKVTGRIEKADSLAHKLLEDLTDNSEFFLDTGEALINQAILYALLDEKDKALKFLSDAFDAAQQYSWHEIAPIYPAFQDLWEEPEFKRIIRKAYKDRAQLRKKVREMENRGLI